MERITRRTQSFPKTETRTLNSFSYNLRGRWVFCVVLLGLVMLLLFFFLPWSMVRGSDGNLHASTLGLRLVCGLYW